MYLVRVPQHPSTPRFHPAKRACLSGQLTPNTTSTEPLCRQSNFASASRNTRSRDGHLPSTGNSWVDFMSSAIDACQHASDATIVDGGWPGAPQSMRCVRELAIRVSNVSTWPIRRSPRWLALLPTDFLHLPATRQFARRR